VVVRARRLKFRILDMCVNYVPKWNNTAQNNRKLIMAQKENFSEKNSNSKVRLYGIEKLCSAKEYNGLGQIKVKCSLLRANHAPLLLCLPWCSIQKIKIKNFCLRNSNVHQKVVKNCKMNLSSFERKEFRNRYFLFDTLSEESPLPS